MTTTALSEVKPPRDGLLYDSQWVNIVNHDNAYRGWDVEEAVNHAVKATLAAVKSNSESALASAEPVAYEERMRPVWDERAPWTPWERCSRESYENFASKPNPWISNDWEIQRRSLYTHAQPAAKVEALGMGADDWRNASGPITPAMIGTALESNDAGVEEDPDSYEYRELIADRLNSLISATPTLASVPDGYVIAPHFRGFADLGLGRYRMFHSRAGVEAELCIVPATPEEAAGRVVGDLRYDGPDEIPAELMAVRLRFENVAGLDALEQQLRLLRETHFLTPPTNQEGAAP